MSSKNQATDVASQVSKLSLNPAAKKAAKSKKKVVDSWEDEDISSDSEPDSRPSTAGPGLDGAQDGTAAPPPTPISPNYSQSHPFSAGAAPLSPTGSQFTDLSGASPPRPEKTDAVARRMIASALGMRVPRQTEEQKAYDKAVREKERKRREEEKEAERKRQQEVEKAKAAVWDD